MKLIKQVQHIMDKYLMTKRAIFTAFVALPMLVSGCVTQSYENDNTPVVQNQSNRDDMAATRISLGLGYLKMGNMSQAKQNLEKAKNFAPNMVQVYTAFAHYYETVGEDEQTIDSYEKALSIKSDDADTLNNYGVYLCRKNKVEEAEKQLLKAIAVPSYVLVAKSYDNLASCFLQIDDFSKAEIYLNKAILHSPSSASTLLQMVQLQYAMGDYQQAKLFEQRFSKVTRRFSPQSLALSYKVHHKLGQRSVAKNYGTMLVKMYPQSWEAKQYLLNELELIEADNLAQRYQNSQEANLPSSPKKRTVKLSPKKENKVAPKIKRPASGVASKQKSKQVMAETTQLDAVQKNQTKEKQTRVKQRVNEVNQPASEASSQNTVVAAKKTMVLLDASKPEQPEQMSDESMIAEKNAEEAIKIKAVSEQLAEEHVESKNFPDFHVVSAGDTLYSISVKYNVKINALRRWNKIAKNKNLHIKDIIFLENPKLVNQ